MLSKIAGLLKGEMSRAASIFASVPAGFLSLLEAFKDQMPGETPVADAGPGTTEAATEEPAAAPEASDEVIGADAPEHAQEGTADGSTDGEREGAEEKG
jgi:hypothetical protein